METKTKIAVSTGTGSPLINDHWYQHFWPWVLILIPFSAVLFGILMIVMVSSYPDDLVVDDYYKDGMAINQIITLDKNAVRMGVTAKLIGHSGDVLRFQVENANDSALVLNLFHVTDSEKDLSLVLYPQDDDEYSATSDEATRVFASTGIWYVELNGADEPWRLRARVITPVTKLEMGGK